MLYSGGKISFMAFETGEKAGFPVLASKNPAGWNNWRTGAIIASEIAPKLLANSSLFYFDGILFIIKL